MIVSLFEPVRILKAKIFKEAYLKNSITIDSKLTKCVVVDCTLDRTILEKCEIRDSNFLTDSTIVVTREDLHIAGCHLDNSPITAISNSRTTIVSTKITI